MPTISALYLYPIKSLGGIAVQEAIVTPRGFQYDRRFMLVDTHGLFITQRSNHHMALIDVALRNDQLLIWHRQRPDQVLELPLTPLPDTLVPLPVTIWDSEDVPALAVSDEADRWFTNALGKPCRLVYMPDTTHRSVEPGYARPDEAGQLPAVSFADGYPYLLIGQASLDELNRRLPEPVTMQRFRPNIVVSGSGPYDEDSWSQFRVGELDFYGVKPCARCVLTTIDPATGETGKEPLRTLSTFRQWKHKILFGQNVLAATDGPRSSAQLSVGQAVEVTNRTTPWLAAPAPLSSSENLTA
ncbi:hypothetical protein GGR92_000955 [Spirosoma lacussanchae]|uniref:MOSC domain-containing protein n=1 Tax=Spirosoma lacussanchae TaxID=1884249 RepID=UPI0011090B0A|nr:MOSC N-terminal beta barrel domain-containing protein [Spirosoma lacussanchae]